MIIGHDVGEKLYKLNDTIDHAVFVSSPPSIELWHLRLGHLNVSKCSKADER